MNTNQTANVCPARLWVKKPIIDLGGNTMIVETAPHEPADDGHYGSGVLWWALGAGETDRAPVRRCKHCGCLFVAEVTG